MPDYPHFIPILNPAPPVGYQMDHVLPLERFGEVLDRTTADIEVERLVIMEGKELLSETQTLRLRDGVWENPEAAHFRLDPIKGSDWANGESAGLYANHRNHPQRPDFGSDCAGFLHHLFGAGAKVLPQ